MPLYEVAIYNQKVIDLVNDQRHHRHLDDSWAETHYFEVNASSAEAARAKMTASHPPQMGYVIESVDEIG